MRLPPWLSTHLAALRALLVFTALLGIAYPAALALIAQLPGLRDQADGSLVESGGTVVGSALIGQSFADAGGHPLVRYFQTRPSAGGYDPLDTGASNRGPEDIVDEAVDEPVDGASASLLTQVCARSKAVGDLEHVDGRRPYCTDDGVGAVLAVFHAGGSTGPVTRVVSVNQPCPATPFLATYQGVAVECAGSGEGDSGGVITPIRGDGPDVPAVPADAVTASGSGLDPDISPDYARLQAPRVARERGIDTATVQAMIDEHTTGRGLGFLGEPAVNVLELNMELDRQYPSTG